MKSTTLSPYHRLLRQGGYKATPGRVAILHALEISRKPLSIPEVAKQLPSTLNLTTIYRALEALTLSGFVRKVNLRHAHAHYELVIGVKHHHHVICEHCGLIEDIENCNTQILERVALKKSKRFASLESHSLEFFGTCRKCAKSTVK